MIINQIEELNKTDIKLLKYIIRNITEEGMGEISFFDSRMVAMVMGITDKNDVEIQDLFINSLINIINIPILIGDNSFPLYDELEAEGNLNWVKANSNVRKNIHEAVDYLMNYVINPDKHSFLVTGLNTEI